MILLVKRNTLIRNHFCSQISSFQQKKLQARFEAQMASSLINMITEADKFRIQNSLNESQLQSLRDKSISHIIQQSRKFKSSINQVQKIVQEKALSKATSKILRFFSKGVWLPKQTVLQERQQVKDFSYQKIKKIDPNGPILGILLNEDKQQDLLPGNKFFHLIFCPTYLVTPQVFRLLKKDKTSFCLYTGNSGIGKSWSFILFKYLSDVMYHYRHYYCSNKKYPNDKIDWSIPRIVYYTLNERDNLEKAQLKILNQCYQYKASFTSFDEKNFLNGNYQKLIQFYKVLMVQIFCVFDQVNNLASKQKKIKELNKIKLTLTKEQQIQSVQSQIIKFKKQLFQMKQIKDFIIIQFMAVVYVSDKDIELGILRDLNLNLDSRHTTIIKKYLKYKPYKYPKQNLLDISQLIIIFMKSRIKDLIQTDKLMSSQKLVKLFAKLKTKLYNQSQRQQQLIFNLPNQQCQQIQHKKQNKQQEIIRKISNQSNHVPLFKDTIQNILQPTKIYLKQYLPTQFLYISPLAINQYLRDHQIKNFLMASLIEKIDYQAIKRQLSLIVDNIYEKQIQSLKLKLDQFIHKTQQNMTQSISQKTQNTKLFLLFLLLQAKNYIKQQIFSGQLKLFPIKIKHSEAKKRHSCIQQLVAKNIFTFNKSTRQFICQVSNGMLLSLWDLYYKDLIEVLDTSTEKLFLFIDTKSAKGSLLQSLLRDCLSKKLTQLSYQQILFKSKKQLNHTMSGKIYPFSSIPKKGSEFFKSYCFFQTFQHIIQSQSKQLKAGRSLLFLPANKYGIQNRSTHSVNNFQQNFNTGFKLDEFIKCIDLVVVSYTHPSVQYFSYDVTVTKTRIKLIQKVTTFLVSFANFRDRLVQLNKQPSKSLISAKKSLYYTIIVPTKLLGNYDWKSIIQKYVMRSEKKLENQISQKLSKNKNLSPDQTQQIQQKREVIQFLKGLEIVNNQDDQTNQTRGFIIRKKTSDKQNKDSQILLKSVQFVSIFDNQNFALENPIQNNIATNLRIWQRFKSEYLSSEASDQNNQDEDQQEEQL